MSGTSIKPKSKHSKPDSKANFPISRRGGEGGSRVQDAGFIYINFWW